MSLDALVHVLVHALARVRDLVVVFILVVVIG